MFDAECALPPAMTPLLRATGDLIGMTLDNARLPRENLRIRLTSERQMLANEVHDSLAQGLTYMRMRMSLLRDAIRDDDELRAHKYCSDVDDTLGNSQRRLRELITYFRSRMDPQGLVHALREISERFLDRTGIALEFDNRAADLRLPAEREIEVFHIVQEALANVCAPRARAARARSSLDRSGRRATGSSSRTTASASPRPARARAGTTRATTASRSCASARAASAASIDTRARPAGPARGSSSPFPQPTAPDEARNERTRSASS